MSIVGYIYFKGHNDEKNKIQAQVIQEIQDRTEASEEAGVQANAIRNRVEAIRHNPPNGSNIPDLLPTASFYSCLLSKIRPSECKPTGDL